jgi:hypothetical protein
LCRSCEVEAIDPGPYLSALSTSAPPIDDNESSLWPTVRAGRAGRSVRLYAGAVSGTSHARQANGGHGDLEEEMARNWPTPRTIDGRSKGNGPRDDCLMGSVNYDADRKRIGNLNPAWVATLMGFPTTWLDTPGPPPEAPSSTHGNSQGRSRET